MSQMTTDISQNINNLQKQIDEINSRPPPNIDKMNKFAKDLDSFTSSFKLLE